MSWPKLAEHPKVTEIPPGTFWAKNVKDQWVIQARETGEELAACASLRAAIILARQVLDSRKPPNARVTEPQQAAQE